MISVEKIIISIIIIFLLAGLCFWGGYSYNSHKYRDKISAIERQLEAERDRYKQLKEYNIRIQEQLDISIRRASEAEELVGAISDGLSGDITDLSSVITAIRELKEKIKKQQGLE